MIFRALVLVILIVGIYCTNPEEELHGVKYVKRLLNI